MGNFIDHAASGVSVFYFHDVVHATDSQAFENLTLFVLFGEITDGEDVLLTHKLNIDSAVRRSVRVRVKAEYIPLESEKANTKA